MGTILRDAAARYSRLPHTHWSPVLTYGVFVGKVSINGLFYLGRNKLLCLRTAVDIVCCGSFNAIGSLPGGRVVGRCALIRRGGRCPTITVTMRDVRCSIVNLDPESASPAPGVLKAVVRENQNNAGIYEAVIRIGQLAVAQTILLREVTEKRGPISVGETLILGGPVSRG